ncbi:hypothetical protein UZ36_08035 [Candidatus Nitromaritima sp. SCGC AAA799-C22]|nr:hypothetical protein UZ36_08035 [Candidatus Nitromaritima sp. SCGC AAA799-C22]
MNFRYIFYIVGIFLILLGLAMFAPATIDFVSDSSDWKSFVGAGTFTIVIGFCLYFINRGEIIDLQVRDCFLITSVSWLLIGTFAAIPLFLSKLGLSYTDAFFETIAGLTTTGSTIFSGLDNLPRGILLWRGLLQWIGGIGIIMLATSIMPFLGVGGMRLFYTESSTQSTNIMLRIKKVAQFIAMIYFGLTLICAMAYYFSGMSLFEASIHSMTTLSTGGFSTSDASLGHFSNPAIHRIAILFMILGSLPFLLYIRALQGHSNELWKDEQIRFYFGFLLATIFILTIWLWGTGEEPFFEVLDHVAFHVTSIVTTTGFTTTDYSVWGTLAFEMFFFLLFIGGCSGSTASGIKIFRFLVIYKLIQIKMKRLLNPRIVIFPKFNDNTISESAKDSVMAFFGCYVFFTCGLILMLSTLGLDFITSASAAVTAIANVGPGLGDIIGPSGNFQSLPDSAKWLLSFGMLAGRLELFTILIMFSPRFWQARRTVTRP